MPYMCQICVQGTFLKLLMSLEEDTVKHLQSLPIPARCVVNSRTVTSSHLTLFTVSSRAVTFPAIPATADRSSGTYLLTGSLRASSPAVIRKRNTVQSFDALPIRKTVFSSTVRTPVDALFAEGAV
jgi:hypothetical protein